MEANRVMSDKEIGEVLATEFRRTSGRDAGRYFDYISVNDRVIAEAQADISFKAGIKEVVEWIKSHGDWDCGHFIFGFDIDQDIWNAKLEEWGIV